MFVSLIRPFGNMIHSILSCPKLKRQLAEPANLGQEDGMAAAGFAFTFPAALSQNPAAFNTLCTCFPLY